MADAANASKVAAPDLDQFHQAGGHVLPCTYVAGMGKSRTRTLCRGDAFAFVSAGPKSADPPPEIPAIQGFSFFIS